mmetsp:Transcript_35668/g.77928  ORF Transcript_35668/g.77928 Transcript_35668/m.77928 type:complete len:237 (-) Transcript_35668:46-756(-)
MLGARLRALSEEALQSITDSTFEAAQERCARQAVRGALRCSVTPDRLQDLQCADVEQVARELVKRFQMQGVAAACSADHVVEVDWSQAENKTQPAGNLHGRCGVCLQDASLKALVPCGHTLCAGCVENNSRTCPTCRHRVACSIPVFSDPAEEERPSKRARTAEQVDSEVFGPPTVSVALPGTVVTLTREGLPHLGGVVHRGSLEEMLSVPGLQEAQRASQEAQRAGVPFSVQATL